MTINTSYSNDGVSLGETASSADLGGSSKYSTNIEKQRKTIEDQGEKQIKAIQDNKQPLTSNNDYKNKLLLSKEREIFKDIYNKRLDKIEELNNKIDYDNLKYVIVSSGDEYSFDKFK